MLVLVYKPGHVGISHSSFDSLSLLKGPQSVKQGNNIAGTVNFDREEIRYDELGMRNSAHYFYGSFNQQNLSVDSSVGYQYGYIGIRCTTRSVCLFALSFSGRQASVFLATDQPHGARRRICIALFPAIFGSGLV